MKSVKSKNTSPEILVRRLIHSLGYRYRLHSRDLPGCPDLVFSSRRKAIFIHGCFWHSHECAAGLNRPNSNKKYWTNKLNRNKLRDIANLLKLRTLGWKTLKLWECELRDANKLERRISRFLQ